MTTGTGPTTTESRVLEQVAALAFINKGPSFENINIKNFYQNPLGVPIGFEIHQSINGFFRYGYITFEDKVGIRETLPLTGNEIITFQYKNSATGNGFTQSPTIIHFNVYDIEETQILPDSIQRFTDKGLKFHVIEAPFFLQYNTNVWTSYFGTPESPMLHSDMFKQHFNNDLSIPNSLFNLNIGKTSTSQHFISPAWKSQMLFSYLLQFARDENGYGNMKLFTTSDPTTGLVNINIQSINNLFSAKNATEYTTVDTSTYVSDSTSSSYFPQRSLNQIVRYKFTSYDISTLASGLPGAHLLGYDYENSQYYRLNDNYSQSNKRKENPYFSNYALWASAISTDNSKRLYIGGIDRNLGAFYLNNKIIEHQYQLRCECMTFVDETIKPGDKVSVSFLSGMTYLSQSTSQHVLDEQMSGYWLVEEIVDAVINGKGLRKMVLMRDSFFNLYDTSAGVGNSKILPQVASLQKTDIGTGGQS